MKKCKAYTEAVSQLREAGFDVDEESHQRKTRVSHPVSGETKWLVHNGDERHYKNYVRQFFKRHGIETDKDRRKRDNQAIRERRAEEAALRALEQPLEEGTMSDITRTQNKAMAQTWHRDQGVVTWRMSPHAAERAVDMGLAPDELEQAFYDPTDAYWSERHHAWIVRNDHIALGVTMDPGGVAVVLTVLWRHREDWEADLSKYGDYGNRSLRSQLAR